MTNITFRYKNKVFYLSKGTFEQGEFFGKMIKELLIRINLF